MTTACTVRGWMRLALTTAALLVTVRGAGAQAAYDIEGTWLVQVTLRNCQTQAPIGAPFNSVVTFLPGGALVESTEGPGFAVGQRLPAHGRWTRTGPATFDQRMLALIAFDTPPNPPASPGFSRGGSVVLHQATLTTADAFTSSGTNGFYDSAAQLYRAGCSTAVGRRFQ